ncbi:MAG: ribosome maturation factor RimM [Clostridiales bacterium]|nr:ribosome maturation factor RimM [Clostridiales bacterium]
MDNSLLEIGKIVNTHGLRGEVKVVPWMDYPEDFEELENIFIKTRKEMKPVEIENVRYQKNNLIVKFKGFNDINDIEQYKNCVLYADREELGELPEGVHYIVDLIGLEVVNEEGEKLGVLADVFNTGANDVYDVKREGKKNLLLPVIDEVVKEIDVEGGKITVHVMEGLDDEV